MESVSGRAREHATLPPSVPLTAAPGPACVYFSGEVLSSGPRAAICTAWLALWEASGLFQHALPEFGACFLFLSIVSTHRLLCGGKVGLHSPLFKRKLNRPISSQ